jgi:hypothetical protein
LPVHPALLRELDGGGGGGLASGSHDGGADAAQAWTLTSPAAAAPSEAGGPPATAVAAGADPTDVLAHPALLCGASPPDFSRLCVACRTVRPLRAKHCGTTGRCIARYDHYCPWTGCVVGAGNLAPFVGMLACWSAAAAAAALVALARLAGTVAVMGSLESDGGAGSPPALPGTLGPLSGTTTGAAGGMALFLVFDGACALAACVLAGVQARQVGANLTTAEAVGGARKYRYLRGPAGRGFANPFDRGSCWANWRDVLGSGGGSGGGRGGAVPHPAGGAAPRRRGGGIAARGWRALPTADDSAGAAGSGSSPPGRRRPAISSQPNRGLEMV